MMLLLEMVSADPEHDPDTEMLHAFLPYIDCQVLDDALIFSLEKDPDAADDFVGLGAQLVVLAALLSEDQGWELDRIAVTLATSSDRSATVTVSARNEIRRLADGSASLYDVIQVDVEWGESPQESEPGKEPQLEPSPETPNRPAPATGDGTIYLQSKTIELATCRLSVWGNGIDFLLDAGLEEPVSRVIPPGEYGWEAFFGGKRTGAAPALNLESGGSCSFVCYEEYVDWGCDP